MEGDEITLAGSDRFVTSINIFIRGSYPLSSGTVDANVRFYANDGSGGAPGTILWDSGIVQDIPYVFGLNNFHFNVPSVLVPHTFTWAIQLSGVQVKDSYPNYGFGPMFYNPPTVGSSNDFVWDYEIGSWVKYEGKDGVVFNLAAQVDASPVSEPTTMLLLGFSLFGLVGYRKKKFFKK